MHEHLRTAQFLKTTAEAHVQVITWRGGVTACHRPVVCGPVTVGLTHCPAPQRLLLRPSGFINGPLAAKRQQGSGLFTPWQPAFPGATSLG